jgi:3-oxoacyl-[acyl-carrier protein] reductase
VSLARLLEGQVALVYGATGRVGSATAKVLAQHGATVVCHYYRNAVGAAKLVADIEQAGGKAIALSADATDESAVVALLEQIDERYGGLHSVVNTVHGDFDPKPIAEMVWPDWDVHLEGLKIHFLLCRHLLPIMRRQRFGRIVFISGGLARRLLVGCSPYTTVKAGLNGFCKALALEEGRHNITVNIVAPGKVIPLDDRPSTDNPDAWAEAEGREAAAAPLDRFATALDVAYAALYFVSPWASCISGQTLYVAGGEIMP